MTANPSPTSPVMTWLNTVVLVLAALAVLGITSSVFFSWQGSTRFYVSKERAILRHLGAEIRAFRNDLDAFPSCDGNQTDESVLMSPLSYFGCSSSTNVLASPDPLPPNLKALWKGPYNDRPLDQLMIDPWRNSIRYVSRKNRLFLLSAGPDGVFDPELNPKDPLTSLGDDLIEYIGTLNEIP